MVCVCVLGGGGGGGGGRRLQCSDANFLYQVCVERCPDANEFGVRDNPVCVDSVDTSNFVNITSGNPLEVTMRVTVSIEPSLASNDCLAG